MAAAAAAWSWPRGTVGVVGLFAHGAGEVVEVLEAGASFEADVFPGAGAVVVGAEEVLDASEVFVEVDEEFAGPLSLEERAVVCQALAELLAVVLEVVEEAVACLGVPVLGGGGAAEGLEEVLEEVVGGGGGLVRVVGVEEGVGEGEGGVVVLAGLWRAGGHGLEELEAVPGEGVVAGRQVVAGEGGGESREEEQEGRGAVPQAGVWGCGRRHGWGCGWCWAGAWSGWVVVRVGAVLGVLPGGRLYVVPRLSLPRFLTAASFRLWFSVLAGGCGGLGEVRWWGGRAWGGGGVLGGGWL